MSQTMKVTNRPNANGHFVKIAKDYGIRLESAYTIRNGVKYQESGFLTKKWGVYGRDEKGLFYCDNFDGYKLRLYRLVHYPRVKGTNIDGYAKWEVSYERNATTSRIIKVWKKFDCPTPLAYKDLDCKKNNAANHKILYGKRDNQKSTTWGNDDVCNWTSENNNMVGVCQNPRKYFYTVKVLRTQDYKLVVSDKKFEVGSKLTCNGDTCLVIKIKEQVKGRK